MITWDHFNVNNNHKTSSFESLSRLLFKENYCVEGTILRSNPNHKGIEVDPVTGKDGLKISFQAKYFSKGIDYSQIKKSFKIIRDNYEGKLDRVYLFSNEDVSTNNSSYLECVKILEEASIECIAITNTELLEQAATSKHASALFFNQHKFDIEWFQQQVQLNLNSLSYRFNKKFNATTDTEKSVGLFCQSELSDELLPTRVSNYLKEIKSYYKQSGRELLDNIAEDILKSDEIENTNDYYKLNEYIKNKYADAFLKLGNSLNELNDKIYSADLENDERDKLLSKRQDLKKIKSLLDNLLLSNFEEKLIDNKILLLKGKAGVGKSHTFAISANNLVYENRPTILLPGYSFIKNNPVKNQLIDLLNIPNIDINNLLDSLDALGNLINKPIVVFIDGINETNDNIIWKNTIEEISQILDNYNYVKFAFSFRNGFEEKLISDYTDELISKEKISVLNHEGLDRFDYEQINIFLDYYNITFSPTLYFNEQMSNPLFLTLFCENFEGYDMDIQEIFNKTLEKIDQSSREEIEFDEDFNLLKEFLTQFVSKMLAGNGWTVSKEKTFSIPFWENNGLVFKKHDYIGSLVRNGLINNFENSDEIYYTFSYNLVRDYLLGSEIFKKSTNLDELEYNILDVLIDDDNLNYSMVDPLLFTSEMGYESYGREIIIPVLDFIYEEDIHLANNLADRFIESFTIRKNINTSVEILRKILNNYEVSIDTFYNMLIDNSIRLKNSTNAYLLDSHLSQMSMVTRDSQWTNFINGISSDSRLGQIISSFESAKVNTHSLKNEQIRLMLILFSWTLTSSNRKLRDRCSKAMIVILKDNFQLCLDLLKRFKNTNDPYVVQRLYGVVFGALVRTKDKNHETYKELVNYVYNTIFQADEVYPDILLRDYARLIIERYLFEYPEDMDFSREKIRPPYNSSDIPEMERVEYDLSSGYNSSKDAIVSSMNTEDSGPGIYGDFGRYVFDSALNQFKNFDNENGYLYAMDYIFNVIGFDEELFPHDRNNYYTERHDTRKVERIGKKYQWIALYNLLAKVADNYLVENDYDISEDYSGPWSPYVRDFDPTLNNRFKPDKSLIEFNPKDELYSKEFLDDFDREETDIIDWVNKTSTLFDDIENEIKIKDSRGNNWIILNHIKEIEKNENILRKYDGKRQEIYNIIQAYFVKEEDYESCLEDIDTRNFYGRNYPEGSRSYEFFNREYYWSSALKNNVLKNEWSAIEIETGEYYEEEVRDYSSSNFENLLLGKENNEEIKYKTIKRPLKEIGYYVLPASNEFLYESQYDGTLEESSISFKIPNSEIINILKLEQITIDGFFYSEDELVAFDTKLIDEDYGLIIKESYLYKFLEEQKYRVFWTLIGEKSFRTPDRMQTWSQWSGYAYIKEKFDIASKMRLETAGESNKSNNKI
ncbi:hypothetical protein HMPREF2811_08105 [Globicatella sp. HMSC072A10]|uniref:hypothetical protein n=1 Tax=Globicatella sp. HMSC072A10 TaxID=1739315 RepID=UPI0008C407EF|nr:hypothetical protein [Globicatella sp. HMSC072A10]OFK54607.1 hypothetical protein HMPREF2811_08105 [Globicatella sp. HMSC072A10]